MLKVFLISFLAVPYGGSGADNGEYINGVAESSTWNVDYVIRASSTVLGPETPVYAENNHCTGPSFAADAEEAQIAFEVPDCWTGGAITFKIYWCPQASDVPQLNETVKWDITWRAITWGADDSDVGTEDTGTVTYTESGDPGDDADTFISTIAIAPSNQTLEAGDILAIHFDRDVSTDTYSGAPIVSVFELTVPQDSLKCDHYN